MVRSSKIEKSERRRRREDGHSGRAAQATVDALRASLLAWYRRHQRPLPWRATRDPYAILVSEIMLQQTRVETVIPYYARFLQVFPTVEALADAPREAVLREWSGLGYYRRARMLHGGAQAIRSRGAFPETASELREVEGVGRYTAGAVASIAFGERTPVVDGNVIRVLARQGGDDGDMRAARNVARIWARAEALVPEDVPGDFNQALMELGATVCTPRAPRCGECPWRDECVAHAEGRAESLPTLSKRPSPAQVALDADVAVRGDTVVLARRTAGQPYEGLWEPPLFSRGELPSPPDGDSLARAPVIVHRLSHRALSVRVVRRALVRAPRVVPASEAVRYDAVELVSAGALAALPVSTLARKILRAVGLSAHERAR